MEGDCSDSLNSTSALTFNILSFGITNSYFHKQLESCDCLSNFQYHFLMVRLTCGILSSVTCIWLSSLRDFWESHHGKSPTAKLLIFGFAPFPLNFFFSPIGPLLMAQPFLSLESMVMFLKVLVCLSPSSFYFSMTFEQITFSAVLMTPPFTFVFSLNVTSLSCPLPFIFF